MEFNKELLKNDVGVHCDTEEKANQLLEWANLNNRKWIDGTSFVFSNEFGKYKKNTVYFISSGTFSSIHKCKKTKDMVITFDEAKES